MSRYGDENSLPPPLNPLVQTILAPSQFLRKHNLELFLSTIDLSAPTAAAAAAAAQDTLLVPSLPTQISPNHTSPITFPVHKTILLGASPTTLIDYGRFTSTTPTLSP